MRHKKDYLQEYIEIDEDTSELSAFFQTKDIDRIFLVCGKSFDSTAAHGFFLDENFAEINSFSDFGPNPKYESVQSALIEFNKRNYDAIVAVGGGSAIDVAKCIKKEAGDLLVAVPTTAGSGAESTHFAVIYKDGKKVSVEDEKCRPDVAVLWPQLLKTLPEYQRKSTMLDALCHALESAWSVNSTDESLKYSCRALRGIVQHKEGYLKNTDGGNKGMLRAANFAGRAIDIAQTTVAHAMSYGLTTYFGIAHGHAAAMCMKGVISFISENLDVCIDSRGVTHLEEVLEVVAESLGLSGRKELPIVYTKLINSLSLERPNLNEKIIEKLTDSVNLERLGNTPIKLSRKDLIAIYRSI